jgi:hypothetical protein
VRQSLVGKPHVAAKTITDDLHDAASNLTSLIAHSILSPRAGEADLRAMYQNGAKGLGIAFDEFEESVWSQYHRGNHIPRRIVA